jgi:hypothetical protein
MLANIPLQEAVGKKGAVQVVKNHPEWPRPYNGITAIRHGDIDRDVGKVLSLSSMEHPRPIERVGVFLYFAWFALSILS